MLAMVGLSFCASLSPELDDALSALDRTRWVHLATDASGTLVAATGYEAPPAAADAYHDDTQVVLSLPRSAVRTEDDLRNGTDVEYGDSKLDSVRERAGARRRGALVARGEK